ncbi:response regulator [Undibacterium aquatile]|uniref:histidine kinase n=2 Tax=Undibacterium aquatile TaxID=1537398 RepID=A0ABR6XFA9_9BURK|nr:response regulator [Undibacterium aquatile]
MNLWLSESRRGDDNLYALLERTASEMNAWVDELKQSGQSARTGAAIIAAAERTKAGLDYQEADELPVVASEISAQPAVIEPEDELLPEPVAHDVSEVEDSAIAGALDEPLIATSLPVDGAAFAILDDGAETIEALPLVDVTTDAVTDALTSGFELSAFDDLPSAANILAETAATLDDVTTGHSLPASDDIVIAAETAASVETEAIETISFSAPDAVAEDVQNPVTEPEEVVDLLSPVEEQIVATVMTSADAVEEVSSGADIEHSVPQIVEEPVAVDEPVSDPAGAKIIEFPELNKPAVTLDDNIKRIGDLEISLPLYSIYMAETDEIVRFLTQDLSEWRHEPERHVSTHAIHASHSLAGSSATVGLIPLKELAHSLESVLQRLERHPVILTSAEFDMLDHALESAKRMLQKFALSEMADFAPDDVRQLDQLLQDVIARSSSGADEEFITSTNEKLNPADLSGTAVIEELSGDSLAETPTEESGTLHLADETVVQQLNVALPESTPQQTTQVKDDLDLDLLPVFLEEGNDLLPMVGQLLRSWQAQPDDTAIPQSIARLMHTIKGSARMAGAMGLGQHIHDMETRIESLMHTSGAVRAPLMDDLMARHDYSMQLFDRLQNPEAHVEPLLPEPLTAAQELDQFQEALVASEAGIAPAESVEAPREMVSLTPLMPITDSQSAVRTTAIPHAPVSAPAGAPVPLVRVRADVLDRLVNQAGEVSISRSRLENEVSTLRSSLGELTANVSRLRDQLREVEIQAETQITSRMALSGDREFDPLEFDRFTRLQELTRMMAESVSDVATVQTNLTRTIDGASGNLHVQARLTRELQQDLMRVRMIPFASVSERLYRVTRQTSKEVDKRVNLDIRGSGVEVDRGVLEKMVGPFEHLLRNAIVHGIETRDVRRLNGKQETGELLIEIRQEGNEVVIRFNDDGQGLDLQNIRQKALSVGLIGTDETPGDAETASLIFEPGFSTANEVTELAGRGVGMDVVRSEAASLGGRVEVSTVEGKGAEFTIRLPLTLAVTQVVLLSSGGRTYAVPSVLVEQVQHLKSNALANAYNDGALMWQGQRVAMHYLSALLGQRDAVPVTQQYTPLLIMKSGTDRVAIHVDDIVGNREVVVKNIGPQLARMVGIAGATVLGSGDVVLILNPVPLAQRVEHEHARLPQSGMQSGAEAVSDLGAVADLHHENTTAQVNAEPVQGLRTQHIVMVVDDSLTVRRVTQRLLTREGYQVVLAKDGIDALEQLQSVTPDVMLVDIEMPRMDGFDLTRNVRSDARTAHIPIIMITSRTADKHRNYARELGVNEYFGKPYREDDLLEAIVGFVGKEQAIVV